MIRSVPLRADHPDARSLLEDYFAELRERLGEFDPSRSVSANAEELSPPHGIFLVLYESEHALACGGIKREDDESGELKRMFVAHSARGRGLGTALLSALESWARAEGLKRLRLDTAAPLNEAIALYRRAGYVEVPAYNDNIYAAHWFEKQL